MGVETEIKFRMPNHNHGAPARLTVRNLDQLIDELHRRLR